MRIFVITIVCLALSAPALAGMYKWTDKNGKVHFTDSLNKVPVDQRNKRHIRKMESIETDDNGLKTTSPAASKHLGSNPQGSHSQGTGIDKQKVRDLQRLIQKKHYNH